MRGDPDLLDLLCRHRLICHIHDDRVLKLRQQTLHDEHMRIRHAVLLKVDLVIHDGVALAVAAVVGLWTTNECQCGKQPIARSQKN